jgi:hypothetical protein
MSDLFSYFSVVLIGDIGGIKDALYAKYAKADATKTTRIIKNISK